MNWKHEMCIFLLDCIVGSVRVFGLGRVLGTRGLTDAQQLTGLKTITRQINKGHIFAINHESLFNHSEEAQL
jgi:hypothetical protein